MRRWHRLFLRTLCPLLLACLLIIGVETTYSLAAYASPTISLDRLLTLAAQEFGVPVALLKTICYMEGRLSNHGGSPSIDNGYGCMHLVKNRHADTLEQAARELGVSTQQLKMDIGANIRGGAVILHDLARQLSPSRTLPQNLADWYGAVALYSQSTTRQAQLLYADGVYRLLNRGFSSRTETGETIMQAAQVMQPNRAMATLVSDSSAVPVGCTNDGNVDYPGAVDCILDPHMFDCNTVPTNAPCTYESAKRPEDYNVWQIVIHDIEGTAQNALHVFQDVNSGVSVHYIVDSDGTVYQVLHDQDIGYHAGNYWYNQHSVGIEHAGFAATGWQWYNAAEYLASAQLTAYLLKKYDLPLDHNHIVGHGTVPSPDVADEPNHVDPGPFWLWDYYFKLIHQQGVSYPDDDPQAHTIMLHPTTDRTPIGANGSETKANFNFFPLYTGPSTTSGLIPSMGSGKDITDETNNVEPAMSYYYLDKAIDPAGTGDTLYKIWYGASTRSHDNTHSAKQPSARATLAWLAVPPGGAIEGRGTVITLKTEDGSLPQISGKPATGSMYTIGDAPQGAYFVSTYSVQEDGTTNQWYEINYNHRQAWVPASEVVVVE